MTCTSWRTTSGEAVRLIGQTFEVTRYDCDNKQWRVWELPFVPITLHTKPQVLPWPDDVKIPSTVLPTSY